ncbi:DUF2442 domain-containing protein [Gemmatimonas sp.]
MPSSLSHNPMVQHPIYYVEYAEVVVPSTLRLRFADELERRIDFSSILAGALFGPLREPALFNQVRVDPEVHTVIWPNGADFDRATLHDWPSHAAAFLAMAQRWGLATR